jgi:hypothetical protein
MSPTRETPWQKTRGSIFAFHPRILRNFRQLPWKMACPTKPLWQAFFIALLPDGLWKQQAEPESPGYLAFRSEPDAYDQLLRYRDALESPPLLVVCDLDRIIVHTNFTGTVAAAYGFPADLTDEAILERLLVLNQQLSGGKPSRESSRTGIAFSVSGE